MPLVDQKMSSYTRRESRAICIALLLQNSGDGCSCNQPRQNPRPHQRGRVKRFAELFCQTLAPFVDTCAKRWRRQGIRPRQIATPFQLKRPRRLLKYARHFRPG